MRILNLYAGIGGNRKNWSEEHQVTAVEFNPEVAGVYKQLFPKDTVIVGDAMDYLLKNFMNFDIVWASPPCPSHSRINFMKTRKPDYPDMQLYQLILFLNKWFEGKFVVENVIPYYKPLIDAVEIDRHLFWSNVRLTRFRPETKVSIRTGKQPSGSEIQYLTEGLGIDLKGFKMKNKTKALRNCVNPETGEHILNCLINATQIKEVYQPRLF